MKSLLLWLLLCGVGWAQSQAVPKTILTAKTAAIEAYWPDGAAADVREVKYEGEHFLKKWKRYQVVHDISQADIAIFVVVEPMTVYPGFWQRWAYVQNAQNFGAREAAPLLQPGTVLTGSILIYDAAELRAWFSKNAPNALKPPPLMVEYGEGNRNKPLLAAGKRLRKAIDEATIAQVASPGSAPTSR